MGTFTKEQEFQIIINAIRFAERHYPEKVEIINEDGRLMIYGTDDSEIFHNCKLIALVNSMTSNCYMMYNREIKKLVLIVF